MKARYTDDQLMEMIRQDGIPLENALRRLNRDRSIRQRAYRHVARLGGNREDLEEIWNSSLVVLVGEIRRGEMVRNKSMRDYWLDICKGLCTHFLRSKATWKGLAPVEEGTTETSGWTPPHHLLVKKEMKGVLAQAFSKLPDNCKELLLMDNFEKNERRDCHMRLLKYLVEFPMIIQELEDLWNWKNTSTY